MRDVTGLVVLCCLLAACKGRVINMEKNDFKMFPSIFVQPITSKSGKNHGSEPKYATKEDHLKNINKESSVVNNAGDLSKKRGILDLRMPNVRPEHPDTKLCFAREVGDIPFYITGFEPHANMNVAHHMLVYGCSEPGATTKGPWNCGMMASAGRYDVGSVCNSPPKVIYAWAMGAKALTLPTGVAFSVGGKTDITWIVLQVHYKDVTHFLPPENMADNSGVSLVVTKQPQPKLAGVFMLGASGEIPPQSTVYMESACNIPAHTDVHPFAYRVHSHAHGKVVSGYRVRKGQWEEISRQSPQVEQMFYPVTNPGMVIKPGDILAARCTMTNTENRTVEVGPTQHDEMCNFYIMYYVDGHTLMSEDTCFTDGPPTWYWSRLKSIHVENSPDTASLVPGQNHVIKATDTKKSEKFVEEQDENFVRKLFSKFTASFGKLSEFFNDDEETDGIDLGVEDEEFLADEK